MRLHFQESFDLGHGQVFSIPHCHQLIECAEEFKSIAEDLSFFEFLADTRDYLGEEVQAINVL